MGKHQLDCWCNTCQRQVTISEVKKGDHNDHRFNPEERAALEAVAQYLDTLTEAELE